MKDILDLWALASVQILGVILTLGAVVILWLANRAPKRNNPFSAAEMFQDENNRTSGSKFLAIIGGFCATWVVVYLAVQGKLDAGIFGSYIFAIVLGKVGTELAAKIGEK